MKLRIAVNPHHKGKHPAGLSPEAERAWFRWYNGGFENHIVTVDELAAEIAQGHGYTAQHRDYRKADNFLCGQHVGLDFDQLPAGTTLADLVARYPFIAEYAALLHTTASHTPDAPRARVLFVLDRPIGDAGKYTDLAEALLWRFETADPSCKDACRLFFGAADCEVLLPGNVLTLQVAADALVHPWRAWKEDQARQAQAAAAGRVTADAGDVPAQRLEERKNKLLDRVVLAPEGEKYYTLRDISRVMGGYVAGGYYTESDARAWLQAAIEARRDTVKSMRHAYATIDEGLAYGRRAPLHFELRERQESEPAEPAPENELAGLEALIRELPAGDPAWPLLVGYYYRARGAEVPA